MKKLMLSFRAPMKASTSACSRQCRPTRWCRVYEGAEAADGRPDDSYDEAHCLHQQPSPTCLHAGPLPAPAAHPSAAAHAPESCRCRARRAPRKRCPGRGAPAACTGGPTAPPRQPAAGGRGGRGRKVPAEAQQGAWAAQRSWSQVGGLWRQLGVATCASRATAVLAAQMLGCVCGAQAQLPLTVSRIVEMSVGWMPSTLNVASAARPCGALGVGP